MWNSVEPVIKYIYLLFALKSILTNKRDRNKMEVVGLFLYGIVVMAGIEWITQLTFVAKHSYFVFFDTDAPWNAVLGIYHQ
ncbi:MAG: hypothetical protein LUG90_04075 [Clostridiaceae bacterium]|nr:hypothetical protein [Clostridiaceae bacterium]